MTRDGREDGTAAGPVPLEFPFRGRWRARNSPARRVPSHGTDLFGLTYSIDFIAVGGDGRSAPRTWRSALRPEPPEGFLGFGMPILAPVAGTVAVAHDGEADHEARRSPVTRLPYAFGQAGRVRAGIAAIAGNHVVIALSPEGPFAALVHLRRGSLRVAEGDHVLGGEQVGECGNSGNSTEPHLHLQVSDTVPRRDARGLPIAFRRTGGAAGDLWMPDEGEIVEAG
ncbi:MAG: M23 family metallopeptidase [Thermoleophilia bacterium]|nr:M23 family metallopeptidase [Thermoleophilia bacterium]